MKPILWILGIYLLSCLSILAESSDNQGIAQDQALDSLFEELSASKAVVSDFVEWRHNALRRVPSRFSGIMRWDEVLGLSLEYKEPRSQVILIREDAVWQKRAGRPPQAMSGSAESDLLRATLLQVFTFEREQWERHFDWQFSGDVSSAWEMTLNPSTEIQGAGLFQSITIRGNGLLVKHLTIHRDHRSRIEIEIHHSKSLNGWDAEELRDAFFKEADAP